MFERGLLGVALIVIATASSALGSDGLVVSTSPHGVAETTDRAESAITERGLGIFARIDHAAGARQAELELPPTELLIFGNPKAGTRLMQCSATVAIDLPLKLLIWEGADGVTQVAYNSPVWLDARHGLGDCASVLENIEKMLSEIAAAAAE